MEVWVWPDEVENIDKILFIQFILILANLIYLYHIEFTIVYNLLG